MRRNTSKCVLGVESTEPKIRTTVCVGKSLELEIPRWGTFCAPKRERTKKGEGERQEEPVIMKILQVTAESGNGLKDRNRPRIC